MTRSNDRNADLSLQVLGLNCQTGGIRLKNKTKQKNTKTSSSEALPIPCCIKEPTPNQKLLRRVKLFSTTSDPGLQGWASYHS